MGCHGVLNAIRVARAYVEADARAVVLVCAVELCSLHLQYGVDPQHMVANALFADGAAALVGAADDRVSSSQTTAWRVAASGSCIVPDSEGAMTWRIGDHGFVMTLARSVPGLIRRHLAPWLDSWLSESGLQRSQIGSWAIHPGGPSIVTAVAGALQLTDADVQPSRQVLAECGNMSSPTVLFILDRLQKAGADRPCVALGFGPGLTVEAALLI
jgi:predicted naringenin-chalcone synthase